MSTATAERIPELVELSPLQLQALACALCGVDLEPAWTWDWAGLRLLGPVTDADGVEHDLAACAPRCVPPQRAPGQHWPAGGPPRVQPLGTRPLAGS
ncbi:hypothetical protein [Streptomyces sp. NBC_01803]|uniref:hypothetical protein n=1 Tax=Streptomyces sp. NBC_01803 TaxID=2975946 RepID=UPI002DD8AD64|nr:hypothetical protein [Streptomyces sp. NBC_01803]WSA44973.1 hypothetical protein OIE51_12585 [Streptomyces sp. NBC_01803]